MRQRITIIAIVVLLLITPLFVLYETSSGADSEDKVLLDMGNGDTIWMDVVAGDTIDDVLSNTASANGIDYSSSGGVITIDGKAIEIIGGDGTTGSFIESGTTDKWVTSVWKVYIWAENGTGYEWIQAELTDTYSSGYLAVAFYPDEGPEGENVVPVETPEYMQSWTMIRGDAEQSGEQDPGVPATTEAHVEWTDARGGISGVLGSVLYTQGYIFAKFSAGSRQMDPDSEIKDPVLRCYTTSGVLIWEFKYPGIESYETTTPVIVGDYIYMQSGAGVIYRIPWKIGPGDNNENVRETETIPYSTNTELTGYPYSTGPGSMIFDSGCLFMNSSNGMVYCFDMDLNLIWSSQMGGHTYYLSPTVVDGYLFSGALNGMLYVMDKTDGNIIDSDEAYTREIGSRKYGSVSSPYIFKTDSGYTIMFSISDGRGMDSTVGGIGIYSFDGASLTKEIVIIDTFGLVSNYLQPVTTSDFTGVYFTSTKGFYRVDTEGNYLLLNDSLYQIKSPPVLVGGTSIYLVGYQPGSPIYEMGLDGKIISSYSQNSTVRNYSMSPVLVVNGMLFVGNDAGLIAISGVFPAYIEPVNENAPWWHVVLFIAIIIAALMTVIYAVLRFVKGIEKPFSYIRGKMRHYVKGEELRHNTKNRHRLLVVLLAGVILTILIFIICLCMGPTSVMSVTEMLSHLASAISKGGNNLTNDELTVYESRLPRTLAALAIGIGLSIAGCMYQAIIRNPLVDPYIMGVSAGAGTAAVAVIAFDFTFFGLFANHSLYLTALSAIVGGILAFLATMFIAEKAGGSSLNYVLAGVVVGLAFSAGQTLMLSMAGQRVSNALSWLFGSFGNVSWTQLWIIVIPAIFLSLVPLLWAKEFNLVLLGEDQAQQMGLNVRRFNRAMLILASVLTAICVAFVGIIGFVGLVVPHLCRMMLGGDHRLVLPASLAFGGALMMVADLISRIILYGQELPVGAITTIIGVPVFAYLLIKRGRLYEG